MRLLRCLELFFILGDRSGHVETSLSRAFCELHMILSLLHALTPKHFSSIAQALICWDLS